MIIVEVTSALMLNLTIRFRPNISVLTNAHMDFTKIPIPMIFTILTLLILVQKFNFATQLVRDASKKTILQATNNVHPTILLWHILPITLSLPINASLSQIITPSFWSLSTKTLKSSPGFIISKV
jgi:hypothetical protein